MRFVDKLLILLTLCQVTSLQIGGKNRKLVSIVQKIKIVIYYTCVISCMKRVASPGSMHDTGCLGLVHWDDPEGWCGEGGGRRVQDGEHMYT